MDSLIGRILEVRQMLFISMVVFLSMAERSAVESAATDRAKLSSHSSNASVHSLRLARFQVWAWGLTSASALCRLAVRSQESVIQWVQITAVPLGVFLLGACIWGIMHNTAVSWGHSFNGCGGGPSEAADEVAGADRHTINRGDAQDFETGETGVELAHRHMDDIASALNARGPGDGMQPELTDVPNGRDVLTRVAT